MPAFLEPQVYILRVGPEAVKYGDPYTASGVVVDVGGGVCEIRGFSRSDGKVALTSLIRETVKCLKAAGFTEFRWERKKDKRSRTVSIRI